MSEIGSSIIQDANKTTGAIPINKFVTIDTSSSVAAETVIKVCGSGEEVRGISLNATTATGQTSAFARLGDVYLTVNGQSANITARDKLKSYTAGIGVKAESDHDKVGAIALESTSTDGVNILVELQPGSLFETG